MVFSHEWHSEEFERDNSTSSKQPRKGTITQPLSLASESYEPQENTGRKVCELGGDRAQWSVILLALPHFTSTSPCWEWHRVRVYLGRAKLHLDGALHCRMRSSGRNSRLPTSMLRATGRVDPSPHAPSHLQPFMLFSAHGFSVEWGPAKADVKGGNKQRAELNQT